MSKPFLNPGLWAQSPSAPRGTKGIIHSLSQTGSQQGGIPARNQTWDSQAKAQTHTGLPFRRNLLRQTPNCNGQSVSNVRVFQSPKNKQPTEFYRFPLNSLQMTCNCKIKNRTLQIEKRILTLFSANRSPLTNNTYL